MKRFIKVRPWAAVAAGCYLAGALLFLGTHLAGYAQNRALYRDGVFVQQQLALSDFVLNEDLIQLDEATLESVGPDPQLLLADPGRPIDTVELALEYSKDPYLVNVFYAAPGEDYSVRRMLYAVDGDGLFLLPAEGGGSLRIDPGTVAGNVIRVAGITVNRPRSFWYFLRPSVMEMAALLVLPGLLACALAAGWEGLQAFKKRPRTGGKGVSAP